MQSGLLNVLHCHGTDSNDGSEALDIASGRWLVPEKNSRTAARTEDSHEIARDSGQFV